MNVRFQYKADIRVDCSERPLSSESGHKKNTKNTLYLYVVSIKSK